MSQRRHDRVVVGGRRATAAGRGHALRARGYNQVTALERQIRVMELRATGMSFRAIATAVGVSHTQAIRDWWGLVTMWPEDRERQELGDRLLRARLTAQGRPTSYAKLAAQFGLPVARVGELVREATSRLLRHIERSTGG